MAAAAATSVVVLDRGNNTTCTINLHGKCVVQSRNLSKAINFSTHSPIIYCPFMYIYVQVFLNVNLAVHSLQHRFCVVCVCYTSHWSRLVDCLVWLVARVCLWERVCACFDNWNNNSPMCALMKAKNQNTLNCEESSNTTTAFDSFIHSCLAFFTTKKIERPIRVVHTFSPCQIMWSNDCRVFFFTLCNSPSWSIATCVSVCLCKQQQINTC